MDKALKLYLKAAEASGKTRLAGRIRAMLKEEKNENDLDSKGETEYNYSRKVPPTDEYATYAMQWAYSDKTAVGEQKLFYRKGKWVLLEKSDDGFVEMGSYTDRQRKEVIKEIEEYNETIREDLYTCIMRHEAFRGNDMRDSGDDGRRQTVDGRAGSVYQGESESNRGTDHEASKHDNRSQIKYSRKTDQDRSTLTKGEAQKQKANYESDKVYTKAEISKMVESLSGLSSIPKRFRTEIVNDIWTTFNSRYSPEQRERHASFLADKIFARVMQESGDAFDNTSQEDLYAMEREIHKALKKIAREGGSPSTRSKLEAEFNTSEAGYWKNVSTKLSSRNRGRFSGTKIKPEGSPIPNRLQIQAFAGSPLGRAPASAGERVVWNIIGFPLAKA